MNFRYILCTRAAAFAVILAALFLIPAAGQAQAVDCNRCDHFTIGVRADFGCPVTICYAQSPVGAVICRNVGPGRSINIPCPVYQAWVTTCTGPYYIVPASADVLCSPVLSFARDCCGQICVATSGDQCTRLEIKPVQCTADVCP